MSIRANDTQGADARRSDDKRAGRRAPRRVATGPIGFGQVFALVRQGQPGARRSAAEEAVAVPTALLLDFRAVQQAAGNTPAGGSDAATVTERGARTDQALQAQHVGAMAPRVALQEIVDQARDMDMQADARELRIELDPEHLGPLVVKIKVDKGRITTELVAREERAAALLASGSAGLRDRLLGLGYVGADVTVEQGEEEHVLR